MKSLAEMGVHAQPKTRQDRCETHGEFESRCFIGSIWSKCPTCDAERVQREQDEAEARERERRRAEWTARVRMSGIPERFQARTLESFVAETPAQQYALAFAKSFADNFDQARATGRSALFVGKPGTGKTHLAAGIGLQVMREQNRTVLFTTVMRAIRRVKDSWAKGSEETESQAVALLASTDLLILDEVGVQFGSEFERNILFDVLNERYEKRRPSILLSNLDTAEVTAYLGERVVDRIREDGGERIVFGWDSYRSRIGAA